MKMKKLILPLRLLLIAVLIAAMALTFASCNKGTETGTQKATETAAATDAATDAATGAGTDAGTDNGTDNAEPEQKAEPVEVEVGKGEKTITVSIIGDKGQSYKVVIKTDAKTLADALTENKIADGTTSEYGLYITTVSVHPEGEDGYEKEAEDGYWWCIKQDGEMTTEGASFIEISGGEEFELSYLAY